MCNNLTKHAVSHQWTIQNGFCILLVTNSNRNMRKMANSCIMQLLRNIQSHLRRLLQTLTNSCGISFAAPGVSPGYQVQSDHHRQSWETSPSAAAVLAAPTSETNCNSSSFAAGEAHAAGPRLPLSTAVRLDAVQLQQKRVVAARLAGAAAVTAAASALGGWCGAPADVILPDCGTLHWNIQF